jgi:hypothetical protein
MFSIGESFDITSSRICIDCGLCLKAMDCLLVVLSGFLVPYFYAIFWRWFNPTAGFRRWVAVNNSNSGFESRHSSDFLRCTGLKVLRG